MPGTRARPPERLIEVVSQGQLEARLADGGLPVDVVVPMWSRLPGRAVRGGSFGLISSSEWGVDNIDLDAAADEGGVRRQHARPQCHARRRARVATAHTASLMSDYFAAASRWLGDALARYLDHQPPPGLLSSKGCSRPADTHS